MADKALLLIDFQRGFDDAAFWGERNNPDAEARAAELLTFWRSHGWPICHVQHLSSTPGSPLGPGPGQAFKAGLTPVRNEPVFQKSVNSAFIGTGLEAHLRGTGVQDVVIAGLTTPHCVSTSVRMAANLGFAVTLAHAACAAFASNANSAWSHVPEVLSAEVVHNTAIHHLHGEFATARASADILAEA